MIINEIRENLPEGVVIFDNPFFDRSIIGVTDDENHVVYDLNEMIKEFAEDNNCSEEDALDFIDYNTMRAIPYMGEKEPIIINPISNFV